MNIDEIKCPSGLTEKDKVEFDQMKRQLIEDGLPVEEIAGICGSFVADCYQAAAEDAEQATQRK